MALTEKLTAIADAVRSKTGKTDLLKLEDMPNEIASISSLADLPEDLFVITGYCGSRLANDCMTNFIHYFGDKFKTKDITDASQLFTNSRRLEYIPFEINYVEDLAAHVSPNGTNMSEMFYNCNKLKNIPKINNCRPNNFKGMFQQCFCLTEFPDGMEDWFDWSYIDNATSGSTGNMSNFVQNCRCLRKLPIGMYRKANKISSYNYTFYTGLMGSCYSLDEAVDIPIPYINNMTSGMFSSCFGNTYRLKRFTFETPNGQPHIKNWKSQTMDMSSYCGWVNYAQNSLFFDAIKNIEDGIKAEDEVKDDTTYQALKNTPNWFTQKAEYSRYNHDSAVETINSLPDTSQYLATAGGTNTIKFKGAAGSKTDGGAINTLTAEEIAVATAKGWTVALV